MNQREPSDSHKHLRLHPLVLALQSVLLSMWSGYAVSLPVGGQVVSGKSNISTPSPRNLVIQQGSNKSAINWQSYNISKPEQVKYQQPSTRSISLNRVQGAEPSGIYGKLIANGQVFLVNPNGIVFGKTARVEVGGLTASTHDISDSDFQAGRYSFNKIPGSKNAKVVNEGNLSSKSGGYVALIGSEVANNGQINTPKGTTALAAGERVNLDLRGDGLVNVQVDLAAVKAKVDHKGVIEAPGGKVFLTAQAKDAVLDTVLNVEGVVRATSISHRNGIIHLDGGSSGVTKVSGQLIATGHQEGQKGGDIRVLGQHVDLQATAVVDASGQSGGGKVLVGGDYQGKAGTRTAETTTVQQGARIKADARNKGNGGQTVVWADKDTRFDGHISARGGKNDGNGGNAEVSGKDNLAMTGKVDLLAPKGKFGTLLLDPGSVTIQDGTGTNTGPNSFDDQFIINQLGLGNLTIATNSATNGGAEVISVAGNTIVTWSNPTTLTLNAGQSIALVGGAVIRNTNASTGFTAVSLNANRGTTSAAGSFKGVEHQGLIETTGGAISINGRGGSTGDATYGVFAAGGTVRTANGTIRIDGQGGSSTGTQPVGVWLQNNAVIEATGTGSIAITGVGGTAAAGNVSLGIGIPNSNAVTLRTTTGSLTVTGTGGAGGNNIGIVDQGTTTYASTSGAITLQGLAPSNQTGILKSSETSTLTSTSGNITLSADRMALSLLNGTTGGTLTIQPVTAGRTINIGGSDSTATLGLTAAELAGLAPSGRLQIGNSSAGNLTVSAAYTPAAGTGTLALVSGGTVNVNQALIGGAARLNLSGTAGVRLGAALSSNAANVASTRAITIRTPGVFNNALGASALSTPNGNWAISLATPVGQNFGGLLSGNGAVWSNPVTSAVTPTGNRYSFALTPTIFVDAGTVGKTYGDVLPTTATLASAPVSTLANTFGGVFTDYQSGTISGNYTRRSDGLAGTANVGNYTFTVTGVNGLTTTKAGYGFAIGNAGVVNVTPRPLTLTANAVSRFYGDANPTNTTATGNIGGLVNGDSVSSVSLSTPATVASNVGSYAMTGSNALFGNGLASNYAITYATNPNGLSVTQRPLTLTANTLSRFYGDANPTITPATGNIGGLVNGDSVSSVSLLTPATATSNVGNYTTTGNNAIFATGLASNYEISYDTNQNGLNIIPRPISLLPNTVNRFYGDTNPTTGSVTVSAGNLVNGNTISSVLIDSPATDISNVGSYASTGANALFGNGLETNYSITYATNANGIVVDPRPVIVTATPGQQKLFGQPDPAAFDFTFSSLGAGQPLQGSLTRVPGEAVGPYPIQQGTINDFNNPNYLITYVGDLFNIAPLVLPSEPLPPIEPIPGPVVGQPGQPVPQPVTPTPIEPVLSVDVQALAGLFSNINFLSDKDKKAKGSTEVDRLISVKESGILLPSDK